MASSFEEKIHRPTEEERSAAFNAHLDRMSLPETYGDHLEIQAFAQAYQKNVKVYTATKIQEHCGGEGILPVVHIAYFRVAEHYCSVRKVDGPFEGLPNIDVQNTPSFQADSNTPDGQDQGAGSSRGSTDEERDSQRSFDSSDSSMEPDDQVESGDDDDSIILGRRRNRGIAVSPSTSPSPPPSSQQFPFRRWIILGGSTDRRRKKKVLRYLAH